MKIFRPILRPARDPSFADAIAARLVDRLADIKRRDFPRVLWIGGGNADVLENVLNISVLDVRAFPVEGDIDYFPFEAGSLDLIIANGTLNRINDLPGALVQMRRALKPDGLFIAAFAGGETLHELRQSVVEVETRMRGGAAPRVHPMVDLQTLAGLLQRAGFALPVADAEITRIYYQSFDKLLSDIRHSGEGMALAEARPYAGRCFWPAVAEAYHAAHAMPDGLLPATIEILSAIGWGPSDAQPKALRPGSAQASLAGALGSVEVTLPDRVKP